MTQFAKWNMKPALQQMCLTPHLYLMTLKQIINWKNMILTCRIQRRLEPLSFIFKRPKLEVRWHLIHIYIWRRNGVECYLWCRVILFRWIGILAYTGGWDDSFGCFKLNRFDFLDWRSGQLGYWVLNKRCLAIWW